MDGEPYTNCKEDRKLCVMFNWQPWHWLSCVKNYNILENIFSLKSDAMNANKTTAKVDTIRWKLKSSSVNFRKSIFSIQIHVMYLEKYLKISCTLLGQKAIYVKFRFFFYYLNIHKCFKCVGNSFYSFNKQWSVTQMEVKVRDFPNFECLCRDW